MKMTVGEFRTLLNRVLDELEDCDVDQELQLQGNTYFTKDNDYVLQTPSGFLGLDTIKKSIVIKGLENAKEDGKFKILLKEYEEKNEFIVYGIYESKREAITAWHELFDNAKTGQIYDAKIFEIGE